MIKYYNKTIKIDKETDSLLLDVCDYTKTNHSSFIRMAVIEKAQRINKDRIKENKLNKKEDK